MHLDQYTGVGEYRFRDDIVRAFGSNFSASISTSSFEVHLADGSIESYCYDLTTAAAENRPGIERLMAFMVEMEGYPASVETEGLSRAIYESVLDWYNSILGRPALCSKSFDAMSVELAARSLYLSGEVIKQAGG